jgi:acetylglutamate kinase
VTGPSTGPGDVDAAALDPAAKAAVLTEALPYIRRFRDRVVVIKHGGAAMAVAGDSTNPEKEADLASFASDVVLMRSVGMLPVVVHGGGPQIGEWMERAGKSPVFHEGLRVTDAETLDIVRMVLVGKVNRDIVAAINAHGPLAVGLSGEDARLITASVHSEGRLGYVGEVTEVDPSIVRRVLAEGLIPVIATIGSDLSGQSYNINADTVAGAVASALSAEKLVYLTDVDGLRRDRADPNSLVHSLGVAELEAMVADHSVADGMIPKAQACVQAVKAGVGHAHVLNGRIPHVLLLEIFTQAGIGTMVNP